MKYSHIACIFLLIVVCQHTFGQILNIGSADEEKDTLPDQNSKRFKARFTPFLAPAVSPETDFMLLAGGLFSFKVEPLDPLLTQSSVPFSLGYSTNKSLLINFRPYIYFTRDKYRAYGDIWVKRMPDNYFGVGYEDNSTIPKGSETSAYKRNWWQLNFRLNRRVAKHFFAGLAADFNKTSASNLNSVMTGDEQIMLDGREVQNRGLGFNIEYDSRDLAVNAYKGLFLNLNGTYYGEYLGTPYNYGIYILDYRQYVKIKRQGRTLAWQVKGRFGFHEVPWPELSQLGTPFDLRGYLWGRYRDREMIFGIVEYRHMFKRKTPDEDGSMISRHGFVTWVGTGSVAPDISTFDHWLPNAGVGYRLEVQPRMNVRLDFGVGKKATGVYVSFNEVF